MYIVSLMSNSGKMRTKKYRFLHLSQGSPRLGHDPEMPVDDPQNNLKGRIPMFGGKPSQQKNK